MWNDLSSNVCTKQIPIEWKRVATHKAKKVALPSFVDLDVFPFLTQFGQNERKRRFSAAFLALVRGNTEEFLLQMPKINTKPLKKLFIRDFLVHDQNMLTIVIPKNRNKARVYIRPIPKGNH